MEDIIEDDENNIINSTKVIECLIELAKKIKSDENTWKGLGLSEEELAFYDVIADAKKSDLKNGRLKNLVKELVRMIRRDLRIDWTNFLIQKVSGLLKPYINRQQLFIRIGVLKHMQRLNKYHE